MITYVEPTGFRTKDDGRPFSGIDSSVAIMGIGAVSSPASEKARKKACFARSDVRTSGDPGG